MNYDEALRYIHSVCWKGSIPGLERISKLCELLGNPQNKLRFIHVAGTNGKGSVSAMLYSILNKAGYRVGLFTSPYLVDFRERMSALGEDISREELCRVVERVRPYADSMEDSPTEFELITACAFEFFVRKGCDTVVLECGMGGRLDSTNVIEAPEISVITNIELDHVGYLGDTHEKIAAEKAGIIKGTPAVCGEVSKGAESVIQERCESVSSPLAFSRDVVLSDEKFTPDEFSFTYKDTPLFVPLCGLYQSKNVRTVLACVEILRERNYQISDGALSEGLSSVVWRARFETLCKNPRIIFDGAHNPDGARYTKATFSLLYPDKRAILVTGVMADKDHGEIASSFAEISHRAFTLTPDNPRSLSAEDYARELRGAGIDATACKDALSAVRCAVEEASEDTPILCAGSLYMYGEIVSACEGLGLL